MITADSNVLVTAQEKLEWVTQTISLMGAEDTDGKALGLSEQTRPGYVDLGPS